MASSFSSHEPLLRKYLRQTQAKYIMEWGPGTSTSIMLEECPDATIVSVEYDKKWFDVATEKFKEYPNVEIYLRTVHKKKCKYGMVAINHKPFDLVFVDGRRRVECAIIAMQCLRDNGVILLHDITRIEYLVPLTPFIDVIERDRDTIVFKPRYRICAT